MTYSCPVCSNYTFTYWERLRVHPRRWKKEYLIKCRGCGENVSPTPRSMWLHFVLGLSLGIFFVSISVSGTSLFYLVLVYICVIWPFVMIRLQKASETSLLKDHLPDSRLEGYKVYLALPIVSMAGAFLLAEIVNRF